MLPDDRDTLAGQNTPNRAGRLVTPVILEPGIVVDNRFEIISFVGKGGMSTVYKAKHLLMERLVALKVLHPDLVQDKDSLQRFQREAKAVSTLEHKNIVQIYGSGMVGNVPFMAIEFLEGISLAELLKKETRLSKEQAVPIFKQILEALAHAHAAGIIHRDLKPSNVMLVGDDRIVKLVDFGIAKVSSESGTELQKLTQTGEIVGTVYYMSPEQCSANAKMDSRSDIYSMGCLMYEVLEGTPPFKGETLYTTISKKLTETPSPSQYISQDFGSIIRAALERDPDKRPQSSQE